MKRLVNLLRQPYPLDPPSWNKVRTGAGIGLFVFLFLYLFQPFNIDQITENRALHVAGYGLVTFIVVILLDVVLPRVWPGLFVEARWTVGKEILYFAANLICIAIGNMLYTTAMGYSSISLPNFIMFVIVTCMVGIFPSAALIMTAYLRKLRKAVREANAMNAELAESHAPTEVELVLQGENQQDRIQCRSQDLLALVSAENYVEVWLKKNGEPERKVIRGSLSQLEQYLQDKGHFLRTHRSYIVNMDQVEAVDGNAQGYQLQLHAAMEPIPVSRRQSRALRDVIHTLA